MTYLFSVATAVALVSLVGAYPDGAPSACCTDMMPQHAVSAQDPATNPYGFLSVTSNGTVLTLTLGKVDGAAPDFKGLFIQARRTGSNTPLGTFIDPLPSETKFRPCPTSSDGNNGVTHNINTPKSSKVFQWLPPAGDLTGIHFVATVVQSQIVFWVGKESIDLGGFP